MRIIDQKLRDEVKLKIEKIERNPSAYGVRRDLVLRELREIGDVYTFFIENPELRKHFLHSEVVPEGLKRRARSGVRAVKNAWNYLLQQKDKSGRFVDALEPRIVIGTNALINRVAARNGRYRTGNVSIASLGYTPPSPNKLPVEVERILGDVKDLHSRDIVEAAIYAHLGLAVLQAFDDGNKRTARLIQDRILWDVGLPPAIIPAGEGTFYVNVPSRKLLISKTNLFLMTVKVQRTLKL